eukprot:984138-Alexandrium_andersonii.AAC.1
MVSVPRRGPFSAGRPALRPTGSRRRASGCKRPGSRSASDPQTASVRVRTTATHAGAWLGSASLRL